jgi:hypothetical protein
VPNKFSLFPFYRSLRSQKKGNVVRFRANPENELPPFLRAKRAIKIENLLRTHFFKNGIFTEGPIVTKSVEVFKNLKGLKHLK